jgi:hypothetical protein
VAQHLSTIVVREPEGPFADPEVHSPLVLTADDPAADTVLAFLGLNVDPTVPDGYKAEQLGYHALTWRCGRSSVFRTVEVSLSRLHGFGRTPKGSRTAALLHPAVEVCRNGGGGWYNFFIHGFRPYAPSYRHLLVADTTGVPLRFYHLHAQYSEQAFQCELRNARNVSIFGVKGEYRTGFLHIHDCDDIRIIGHGGNGKASPGGANYLIERTPNFLIANQGDQVWLKPSVAPVETGHVMAEWRNLLEYAPLIDRPAEGPELKVPSLERPILYRRGRPGRAAP